MKGWLTLREIEELYDIKHCTLRSYINKNQVVPKECYEKIGNTYVIKKDWVEEKYKHKKR